MGFYIADPPPRLTELPDSTYIRGMGFVNVPVGSPVTRTETPEEQAEMLTQMRLNSAYARQPLPERHPAPGRSKAERAKILDRIGESERAEKYARKRQRRAAW